VKLLYEAEGIVSSQGEKGLADEGWEEWGDEGWPGSISGLSTLPLSFSDQGGGVAWP
jgi:hypothetical protein